MSLYVGRDSYPASFGAAFAASGLKGKSFGPAWLADFLLSSTSGVLPSGVTVSSPSLGGLVTDSTGKLTYKPNNLLTYSNTFSNAAWASSGVTVTANQPDPFGGNAAWVITDGGISQVQQLVNRSLISSHNIYSLYAKAGTAGYIAISITGNAGYPYAVFNLFTGAVVATGPGTIATVRPAAGGYYQISIVADSANNLIQLQMGTTQAQATPGVSYSGAGNTVYIYGATASAVTYETSPRPGDQVITTSSAYYGPAWDYDTSGNPLGLRIWEARTNLVLNSSDYTSANWTKTSITVSANATTAPDGTSTAQSLTPTAISSSVSNAAAITTTNGTTYTRSLYVKKGTGTYLAMDHYDGAIHLTIFNPNTGTFPTVASGDTASAVALSNGWYRISVTFTGSGAATTFTAVPSTSTTQALGDVGNYHYVWGQQLEIGAFAGPYIPTGASAGVGVADVVTLTGTALAAVQGSAFTAIAEIAGPIGSTQTSRILGGTGDTGLLLAQGLATVGAYDGATVPTANAGSGNFSATNRTGIAVNASNALAIAMNGGTVGTGTFTTRFSTVYLGSNGSQYFFNTYFRKLALYTKRLPDPSLQYRTNTGVALNG